MNKGPYSSSMPRMCVVLNPVGAFIHNALVLIDCVFHSLIPFLNIRRYGVLARGRYECVGTYFLVVFSPTYER